MIQLWSELRDLGVEEDDLPTARAFEDWQLEGLIETDRRWSGRPTGSESLYVAATAEKVVELMGVLEGRRSFDWARMAIFYQGFDVDIELLRGSYVRVIDELEAAAKQSDEAGLNEAIAADARRHSRTGQRRLLSKTFDESSTAVLARVMRNAFRLFFTDDETPLMPEDTDEIAVAHGVPLNIWEKLLPDEVESFEDKLDLDWMRHGISELNQSELSEARDHLLGKLRSLGIAPEELEHVFIPLLPVFALFSPDVPPPD